MENDSERVDLAPEDIDSELEEVWARSCTFGKGDKARVVGLLERKGRRGQVIEYLAQYIVVP